MFCVQVFLGDVRASLPGMTNSPTVTVSFPDFEPIIFDRPAMHRPRVHHRDSDGSTDRGADDDSTARDGKIEGGLVAIPEKDSAGVAETKEEVVTGIRAFPFRRGKSCVFKAAAGDLARALRGPGSMVIKVSFETSESEVRPSSSGLGAAIVNA